MYEIKVSGLDELKEHFKKAPEITGKELEKATKSAGAKILATEKAEVPIKTGQLRRSVQMDYKPISVAIYPTVKYALPVHEGAKPHAIYPKAKKVLKFKIRGKTVYARKVNHPGSKANKFVERTVKNVSQAIDNIFAKVLDNIINFLAK